MYFNFQFYHLLTSQIQSSLKMKDRLKRSYLTFGLVIGIGGLGFTLLLLLEAYQFF